MPSLLNVKQAAAVFAVLLSATFLGGCVFGGGDDGPPSVARRGSIPTATPPSNPPEPLLLGQALSASPGQTATTGSGNNYVVKSGDTLFGIAGQMNVPLGQQAAWVSEVLRLNSLGDGTILRAGQDLRLPAVPAAAAATSTPAAAAAAATATPTTATAAAATATPVPTTGPRPTIVPGAATYTVVSGDNPYTIADKLGIPAGQQQAWTNQLMSLNSTCASCLQIGQVLQLPPTTP